MSGEYEDLTKQKELVAAFEAGDHSFSTMRDLLRSLRLTKTERPDIILRAADVLWRRYESKLGDELWSVLEQLFFAAVDCDKTDTARTALEALRDRFPESKRVAGLVLLLEEIDDSDYVQEFRNQYGPLLELTKSNSATVKRKVAYELENGNLSEALKMLFTYLSVYSADVEAWLEVTGIYMQLMKFEKAQFAFEEVLLSNPNSPVYLSKYGEILYAIGTETSLLEARKYFARSLDLVNSGNTRALWGLQMTTQKLANIFKSQKKDEKNRALFNLSKEGLEKEYSTACNSLIPILQRVTKNDSLISAE